MLVVADTSPIHYLILIAHDAVLPLLYAQVVIPPAVLRELQDEETPEPVRLWVSNPPSWFEVRAPQQQIPVTDMPNLGLGEREAIVLAQELRADVLLIDERDGRRAARSRALAVVGTLGVLEKAAAGGLIDLPGALARLQATSFYAPPALFEEALARDAARKRPDATGLRGEITTH
jgi:predicted nucleic acid-binding protein